MKQTRIIQCEIRKRLEIIIQNKKLSYTWNVDEHSEIPETIVMWTLEPLDRDSQKLKQRLCTLAWPAT